MQLTQSGRIFSVSHAGIQARFELSLLFWFDTSSGLSWCLTYHGTACPDKETLTEKCMTEAKVRWSAFKCQCQLYLPDFPLTFSTVFGKHSKQLKLKSEPLANLKLKTDPEIWDPEIRAARKSSEPKSNLSHGEGPAHDQVGHSPGVPDRGEPPGKEEPAGALCQLHPHPNLSAAHLHHRPAEQLRRWNRLTDGLSVFNLLVLCAQRDQASIK